MVEDYLRSYGYTKTEINKIINNKLLISYNENTILLRIKENLSIFEDMKIKKSDIIKLTLRYPQVFCVSVDKILIITEYLKSNNYNSNDISKVLVRHPAILTYSIDKLKNKKSELISLGFTKKQAEKIINDYPEVYGLSSDDIKKKFAFYSSLNLKKESHKLLTSFPEILGYNNKTIELKIIFFKNLGFNMDEIRKIVNRDPLVLGCAINTMTKNIHNLNDNITFDKILEMIKKYPAILYLDSKNLFQKKKIFVKLGYDESRYYIMITKFPQILGLLPETIVERFNDYKSFGFTDKEVISMSTTLPTMYGYNKENVTKKMKDLENLNLSKNRS